MSLYTPRAFGGHAHHEVLALLRAAPFATLITSGDGEPHITHLPLLLDGDTLIGHMAHANGHWQAFAKGHTLAVFHGPHTYISPQWYLAPEKEVPTWNYATVHVHGQPQLLHDLSDKLAILAHSSAAFENPQQPWTLQLEPEALAAKLKHIVAFCIPMTRIESTFKMNQNKTAADRQKVIAHLRHSAAPDALAVADWMQAHEPH